jgi:PKD repeat protein
VDQGAGTASGAHPYTEAGLYTIRLTVVDDDAGSSSVTFSYVVVYNAAGGFALGGGRFDSPAGVLVTDPTSSGRAYFGFSTRYRRGAETPSGLLWFGTKGLRFRSTSYDWLVIADAKATLTGGGRLDGSDGYRFLLSVIDDGRDDTLRLKIWESAGGAIIYDNQLGAADDADPTTVIDRGSIIVHTR